MQVRPDQCAFTQPTFQGLLRIIMRWLMKPSRKNFTFFSSIQGKCFAEGFSGHRFLVYDDDCLMDE
jgi:hypothetical protein